MKVNATSSFFESIKRIGTFSDKFKSFIGWVKYHFFNKNFKALVKEVYKSYPWDHYFLYRLEKAKIEEMRKYHEKTDGFVGVEYAIRDMKICERLIDIFTGEDGRKLYHFEGNIGFVKDDDGTYSLSTSNDYRYVCDVNVNTKNIKRFTNDPKLIKFYLERPDEFYELKAKHLYHKIRFENDGEWWY